MARRDELDVEIAMLRGTALALPSNTCKTWPNLA
jgi:hypothetical protein